jgi:hypothetical protein
MLSPDKQTALWWHWIWMVKTEDANGNPVMEVGETGFLAGGKDSGCPGCFTRGRLKYGAPFGMLVNQRKKSLYKLNLMADTIYTK